PIGPFPIPFLWTKLDVFFAVVLFILLLPVVNLALRAHSRSVTAAYAFYLFVALVTSLTSSDVTRSLKEWAVVSGYASVSFLAPVVILGWADQARRMLFLVAVVTGI